MTRVSRVLQLPTERSWSWAPFKKAREIAQFPALKVLFCGSDHFSVPSFTMLRELHLRHNDIISHLAVLTPMGKLSGRGMTTTKPAPMTILAKKMNYVPSHVSQFNLKLDEIPAGDWDLLIAVSFGHKISAEVLDKMTYGGLNIHPSMLPRYRGPAPLHHALLNGDEETGVCIQTLHPTRFDYGQVLMQSESIPIKDMSLDCLHTKTARLGADMLRDLLVRGYPVNAPRALQTTTHPSYAPKLKREDMEINWSTWPVDKIVRWDKILGTLWTRAADKVIKVNDLQVLTNMPPNNDLPGTISMQKSDLGRKVLVVRGLNGHIRIGRLTVAGKKEKSGSEAPELTGTRFGL